MSEAIIVRAGNLTKGYVNEQLDLKANTADLGTAAVCDTGTSGGNVPILNDSGKLDTSILPSLAITDTFEAGSDDAMAALNAQKGDICIRSDKNKTYVLKSEPATVVSNWVELATPTDTVLSVNGKIGTVTLNHEDVGAVEANTAIASATKCKITYDSKGLVTAGADLEVSDIPDISETYETKSNKSDSFTESSSEAYASTKALVDGLATKSEFKRYTATVGTSWTKGSSNEYTQEVSVSGILETDTPTIDLVLSDNVETAKSQIEAWSSVSRITTSTGKIKIYCYDTSPTVEIPIQLICVR